MLPKLEYSLKQSVSGCQVRSSPLVEEALNIGCILRSVELRVAIASSFFIPPESQSLALSDQGSGPRVKLPCGHRYFPDCLREQEARLLGWLIHTFQGNAWYFTQTFKDWIRPERADRLQARFLGCLTQSLRDISGAALLCSVSSSELQQRDVIHYHLLIFGIGLGILSRKRWENRWQLISGGFAANYEAELKAAPYLVKHQIKGRLDSSLHFGGSWRGITPPRSVGRCCSRQKLYEDELHIVSKRLQGFGLSPLPDNVVNALEK